MIRAGWVDEVRNLIAAGVPADAKPFQFIGYSELRQHLEGGLSEKDAVAQIQQATRQFAKRQLTWYRRESGVNWLPGFGDDPKIQSAAIEIVRGARIVTSEEIIPRSPDRRHTVMPSRCAFLSPTRYNRRMPIQENRQRIRSTTVLCVRKDNKVVLAADGQVTMGEGVIKHNAKKTRRLYNDKIVAGFAGSTADALSLFGRFENKLQEYHGNLSRAAVELAKEWRTDRSLRHLEALLDRRRRQKHIFVVRQWRRDRAR